MNSSTNSFLPSSIINLEIHNLSFDVFYIGTLIGLISGSLCACIIIYFTYKKKRKMLDSQPCEVAI